MTTLIQHGSTPTIPTPVLKVATPPGVRTHTETINFPAPFHSVPQVTVSLNGIDAAEEKNLRIRLEVSEVAATHFKVNIIAWFDTIVHAAGITWIATIDADAEIPKSNQATTRVFCWDQYRPQFPYQQLPSSSSYKPPPPPPSFPGGGRFDPCNPRYPYCW